MKPTNLPICIIMNPKNKAEDIHCSQDDIRVTLLSKVIHLVPESKCHIIDKIHAPLRNGQESPFFSFLHFMNEIKHKADIKVLLACTTKLNQIPASDFFHQQMWSKYYMMAWKLQLGNSEENRVNFHNQTYNFVMAK